MHLVIILGTGMLAFSWLAFCLFFYLLKKKKTEQNRDDPSSWAKGCSPLVDTQPRWEDASMDNILAK